MVYFPVFFFGCAFINDFGFDVNEAFKFN